MKAGKTLLKLLLVTGISLSGWARPTAVNDRTLADQLRSRFESKTELQKVMVDVTDHIATLMGTVDKYPAKLEAQKLARKTDGVKQVRNEISVLPRTEVSDAELQQKLARKLRYDGYSTVFDNLELQVNRGVVTLEGEVRTPVDKDSALAIVENMTGVRDVQDQVKVLPVSGFDDQIRLQTARAIYRDPVLSKYALDPQRPIRIVVDRGKVTLYGTVDNAMDKQIAGLRANQVPGAFAVTNRLVVEGM